MSSKQEEFARFLRDATQKAHDRFRESRDGMLLVSRTTNPLRQVDAKLIARTIMVNPNREPRPWTVDEMKWETWREKDSQTSVRICNKAMDMIDCFSDGQLAEHEVSRLQKSRVYQRLIVLVARRRS